MDPAHKIMSEIIDHYHNLIETFRVVVVSSKFDYLSALLMSLRPDTLPVILDFHAPSFESELFNALRTMAKLNVPIRDVYLLCPGGVKSFTSSREDPYEALHKFSEGLKAVFIDPITCVTNEAPDIQLTFLRHRDLESVLPDIGSLHRLRSIKLGQ